MYSISEKYILRTHNISNAEVSNLTVNKIKELCATPLVSEAIFLATPVLHKEMIKYLKGEKIKDENKLISSLLKYLLRMGNRCTPFGLFSGYSIGTIDEKETLIELNDVAKNIRSTKIDTSYLCSLINKFEKSKEIRKQLKYYPNTSMYKIGNELRYVEFKYVNARKTYYTMSIDQSEIIDLILKKSKVGKTIHELATLLVEPEISLEDAKSFIHELIDNQILISSIAPSVTGQDYLTELTNNKGVKEIKADLEEVNKILEKLDSNKHKDKLNYYKELTTILSQFGITYNESHLFHTDLVISTKNNKISQKVAKGIREAIEVLNKLSPYRGDEKINNFKKKFYNKFEGEQIPLAIALDVETGVGYGFKSENGYDISPLISGLAVFRNGEQAGTRNLKWTKVDDYLHQKLIKQNKEDSFEIELTDNELKNFKANWNNLPLSFNVMASILDNNPTDPQLHVSFAGGPSAMYMLGRFSQKDEEMSDFLKEISSKEAALKKDSIVAEIAHLPEDRMGNILNRSHLRGYEIPYMAKSTLPLENQINIDDILISIEDEKIILFSKKHNKTIEPRMASAHNFSEGTLPIYNFLCDIQAQDLRYTFEFDWGNAKVGRTFLPRVRYKNTILSPAQWIITKSEIEKMITSNSVEELIKNRKIPQRVLLKDFDNELLIDLKHELSVTMFLATIKKKPQITLVEHLFDEEKAIINNKQGKSYNNEILFSFVKKQ